MDKNTFTQNLMGQISSLPVPKVKGRKSPYDFSVAQNAPQSRNTDVGISSATAPVKSSPAKSEYINSIASSQQIPSPAGVSNVQTPSGAMVNPSTGAMVSGPTPDPKQGYKDAFQEYLNSLRPSQEETQARTYLNKLLDTSRREEEEALNRGETLGFASGEAARVGRNRAFDIEAASGALGALTGDRQAMTEAQKARLEFEKSMLPEEKSISDQYGTGAIGEYNFAKSQGYKGSFTDYQNEDANRKKSIAAAGVGSYGTGTPGQLSPLAQAVQNGTITIDKIPMAQRAQIAAELAASGIPSGLQQTRQANLDVVDSLLNNPNRNKISGYIQGKLGAGSLLPGAQLALNQFDQLKGILSLANREQLKGTGAISDFEFKILSQAATALGRNLNDAQFNEQLQKIRDVFAGKYRLTTATQASDVVEQNQGGVNNPLGI